MECTTHAHVQTHLLAEVLGVLLGNRHNNGHAQGAGLQQGSTKWMSSLMGQGTVQALLQHTETEPKLDMMHYPTGHNSMAQWRRTV